MAANITAESLTNRGAVLMDIIKFFLQFWAILSLIIGVITALLGAPLLALFPIVCAIACNYSAHLIEEILE